MTGSFTLVIGGCLTGSSPGIAIVRKWPEYRVNIHSCCHASFATHPSLNGSSHSLLQIVKLSCGLPQHHSIEVTSCPCASGSSPFVRLARFIRILSPVLDSFQKVHLFQVTTSASVSIKFVLDIT